MGKKSEFYDVFLMKRNILATLASKVLLRFFNENVLSIRFVKMNIHYLIKEIVNKGTLFYNIVDNSEVCFAMRTSVRC